MMTSCFRSEVSPVPITHRALAAKNFAAKGEIDYRIGFGKSESAMNYGRSGRNEADLDAFGAIRVGAKRGPEADQTRWIFALNLFFRLVALIWIAEGLEQWGRIIAPASGSFLDLSTPIMSATIFFAVLNPIAAVGLWLIAPWGWVVWLLTLIAQVFVVSMKPSFFLFGGYLKLFDGLLLALYLLLSWRANIASGELTAIDRIVAKARDLTLGPWRRS